jgi:uncharacterized protein (DUF2267 family)
MTLKFEKHKEEGNKIILALTEELGFPWDTDRAGQVLISILHAVRNRLDVDQSLNFLRQLPSSLRVVFVDGWNIKNQPCEKIKDIDDFILEVRKVNKEFSMQNFLSNEEIIFAIQSVFRVLEKFIGNVQNEKMTWIMPEICQRSENQINSRKRMLRYSNINLN